MNTLRNLQVLVGNLYLKLLSLPYPVEQCSFSKEVSNTTMPIIIDWQELDGFYKTAVSFTAALEFKDEFSPLDWQDFDELYKSVVQVFKDKFTTVDLNRSALSPPNPLSEDIRTFSYLPVPFCTPKKCYTRCASATEIRVRPTDNFQTLLKYAFTIMYSEAFTRRIFLYPDQTLLKLNTMKGPLPTKYAELRTTMARLTLDVLTILELFYVKFSYYTNEEGDTKIIERPTDLYNVFLQLSDIFHQSTEYIVTNFPTELFGDIRYMYASMFPCLTRSACDTACPPSSPRKQIISPKAKRVQQVEKVEKAEPMEDIEESAFLKEINQRRRKLRKTPSQPERTYRALTPGQLKRGSAKMPFFLDDDEMELSDEQNVAWLKRMEQLNERKQKKRGPPVAPKPKITGRT
jgi:hypothetical protein